MAEGPLTMCGWFQEHESQKSWLQPILGHDGHVHMKLVQPSEKYCEQIYDEQEINESKRHTGGGDIECQTWRKR